MGEQKKKDTVCPFSFVKEPKQGVSGVKLCFAPETTMRREWDVVRTYNVIRSYPKYKNFTHVFIRKECFKANHDKQIFEIISTISQSMNKNKK